MVPAPIPVLFCPRCGETQRTSKEAFLHEGAHLRHVLGGRGLKARGAIPHHIAPQGAVGNLQPHVYCQRGALHRIEILREALPAPLNALDKRGPGDVLHPFHELNQPFVPLRGARGKAHPAVAHHHGGHPVARGGAQEGIPGHLAIKVRMDIHKARRDEVIPGVDLLAPGPKLCSHGGNKTILERHIHFLGRGPGAVNHRAATNDTIKHLISPPEGLPQDCPPPSPETSLPCRRVAGRGTL